MSNKFYRYDGRAVKTVSLGEFDDWMDAQMDGVAQPIARDEATRNPWVRRAQKLRAGAITSVPFAVMDGENDVTDKPRFADMRMLISKAELSLTKFGGAYWYLQRNRGGYTWPMWWTYPSVTLVTDDAGIVLAVKRRVKHIEKVYPLKDVLTFFEQDEDVEDGPGQAALDSALYAASALHNADVMVDSYFTRDGTRVTIFGVPQITSDKDINALKAWWRRLTQGVRNAFVSVFYRGELKPIVVGDPLSEIWSADLTRDKRADIAAAFQMPVSVLLSNAADRATAESDMTQWYTSFVFPRCAWYADTINRQWLDREGLELVFYPEQTEIAQAAQLSQVQSVTAALDAGIIDVNEARALIGYDEIAQAAMPEVPDTDEDTNEDNNEDESLDEDEDAQKSLLRSDIQKWERYAAKRWREGNREKALQFQSDTIPPTLQASIRGALSEADEPQSVSEIFRNVRLWEGYGF